jgi:hypothetical protein
MTALLRDMNREFGLRSRLSALLGGPYVLWKIRQEERRLANGWTYEPPTFYEVNDAVNPSEFPSASGCSYVTPRLRSRPADTGDPTEAGCSGAGRTGRTKQARHPESAGTVSASGPANRAGQL